MNWFKRKKRTSGNQEIRDWDIRKSGDQEAGSPEPGEFPNRLVSGTGRSMRLFRLATPVLLALFTSFLIRLRRIPRIFALYSFTAKIRGAVRYFLELRNIEQVDSATRQRMTPTSMAKLSWILLIKNSGKFCHILRVGVTKVPRAP